MSKCRRTDETVYTEVHAVFIVLRKVVQCAPRETEIVAEVLGLPRDVSSKFAALMGMGDVIGAIVTV